MKTLSPQLSVHVDTAGTALNDGLRPLLVDKLADAGEQWLAERLRVFASAPVEDHDATEALLQESFVLDPGQRKLLWDPQPRLGFVRDYSLRAHTTFFLPRIPREGIHGEGLVLTYPRLTDVDDLLKNDHDAEVRRYSIFGPTRRSALTMSLATAYYSWRTGDSSTLATRDSPSGPPLATVSVRKLVPPVFWMSVTPLSHTAGDVVSPQHRFARSPDGRSNPAESKGSKWG